VCAGCGVREDCLEFAVLTNQEFGVWGGTSEEERRRLRQAQRSQIFLS
jgi:WhiB family transcriptional regulator, redox-sensing transcriptional regulator